jgi:3-deoxy-D-manno-octulosonic-acid transferase
MLQLYRSISGAAEPLFSALLASRVKKGKEIAERLPERQGRAHAPRPPSPLVWIHAASVGESQSALILINRLTRKNPGLHILMTTGTVSSANMMQKNLPANAVHQFYPLDHPDWVKSFLDHWHPDLVLWMESELWPNMLGEIKKRSIPAILVNARLSDRSFRRWSWLRGSAGEILSSFNLVLTQSDKEAARYKALGANAVISTGNLKYSAQPLPAGESDLKTLNGAIGQRPLWLYASSHKGEEALACRVHEKLKASFPDILTIIVPRHPERRDDIADVCKSHGLNYILRCEQKNIPAADTDIYIADTFGELGLFYRLALLAVIGRSFSDDGGGGHNPIEAAQLNCAVLYGPHVQYQKELFDEMTAAGAARPVKTETELLAAVRELIAVPSIRETLQKAGYDFVRTKGTVVDSVIESIEPWLQRSQKAGAA